MPRTLISEFRIGFPMVYRLRIRQRAYPFITAILFLVSSVALFRWDARWVALLGFLSVPVLVLLSRFEEVVFTGTRLTRQGMITRLVCLVTGQPPDLPIDEIEMVATESTRLRYRPDRVRYHYRTLIIGNTSEILLHSGERGYHAFVKALFQTVGETKLDPRSSELLHYLDNTAEVNDFNFPRDYLAQVPTQFLRGVANSLRLSGRMSQALNYFTLAYQREPNNPHLLYEMGRFLRSFGEINDPRLLSRSSACLRLAARISHNESNLLERIGETYFERLEYERASKCFARALELNPNLFRANVGLAEIALRSGKLAHVVHHYNAAALSSNDQAQMRLAKREADYYDRLCRDEDYFEAEISRINMLRHFRWARTTGAVVFFVSLFGTAFFGGLLQSFEELGWYIAVSSGFVWVGAAVGLHLFNKRLDTTLFEPED